MLACGATFTNRGFVSSFTGSVAVRGLAATADGSVDAGAAGIGPDRVVGWHDHEHALAIRRAIVGNVRFSVGSAERLTLPTRGCFILSLRRWPS
jgi:hypothetical protein